MKYTNKFGLPSPMVKALTHDDYDYEATGDISVTSLIKPPRIRQLEIRYADQLVEDVSDRIWLLMGNMGHVLLEWADVKNALQEERLSCEVLGWTVTGKADLYEPPATVSDYKITSTWSVIYVKKEWEEQLNLYAHLYRGAGFNINKLQVVAVLRDWVKSRARREPSYPQVAVQVVPQKIWPDPVPYLESRVSMHQMAVKLADDDLPYCTAEERWEKETGYAVVKDGNKRATRVYSDPLKANQRIKQLELSSSKSKKPVKYHLEERLGESTRCEYFCNAQPWCNQYKEMNQ